AMLGPTARGSRMPQPLTHTAPTPENRNELGPDLPNYYCKRHPAQGSSRPRHSMRGCAAAREADLPVQDEIGAKPSPTETRVSTGGATTMVSTGTNLCAARSSRGKCPRRADA